MSYLIRATRHFYAGTIHSGRVLYFGRHGFDSTAPIIAFATRDEAQSLNDEAEAHVYLLGHGEYSRPTLRVVKASAAPSHLHVEA